MNDECIIDLILICFFCLFLTVATTSCGYRTKSLPRSEATIVDYNYGDFEDMPEDALD